MGCQWVAKDSERLQDPEAPYIDSGLYPSLRIVVTRGGLEPPTKRLRVFCSTIELAGPWAVRRMVACRRERGLSPIWLPQSRKTRSDLVSEQSDDRVAEPGHPGEDHRRCVGERMSGYEAIEEEG